jgi:iron(III) transport system substrate-binding protein
MYQYQADGLLAEWEPSAAPTLPPQAQTETFWGTRVLHLVVVSQAGNPTAIEEWRDLADGDRTIAFPDPRFAGSAFAALGHFGLDYFRELQASGAVQLSAPGEVVTGVAEGRYDAGLTLEFSARSAVDKGSPIEVVWPRPAAVAVTSPIAVLADADPSDGARDFVDHVLSAEGQTAIGATGWSPILAGIPGPPIPPDADIVYPDWAAIYAGQESLVAGYVALFDG